MADAPDKDSKTEPASEKKIRDTVEKGQLPFSKEAPLFFSFVAILVFTIFFAYDQITGFGAFLSAFLERPEEWSLSSDVDASSLYEAVFLEIGKLLVVFVSLMVVAGIGGSIMQNTPRAVLDRVQPKLSRISPMGGWKRLFGAQGIAEFLKSVGKLLFTIAFLVATMRGVHTTLLEGMLTEPESFGLVIRDILIQLLVTITLVMAAIAGVDLLWQRFHWLRDLMMTKQEVKDEHKQAEGDPIVKARIRSIARDRARKRMMAAVPKATLIIANPTHYSIALRYVRDQDAAPVVVAKGQDLVALRIREIAQENNIPIFENVELARSMYKQVAVDSMIPAQFYQAVAELIRIVYARSAQAQRSKDRA
ncbi:MAG TPA: flagellar biosynthesis protein FlhB [Rhizobiales bacterium]|nr:flagellar biosynthesis protein FlhB [Hyphomicrobiales bacterium]